MRRTTILLLLASCTAPEISPTLAPWDPVHARLDLDRHELRAATGRFCGQPDDGTQDVEVVDVGGALWLVPARGTWIALSPGPGQGEFVARDARGQARIVRIDADALHDGGLQLRRRPEPVPDCPPEFARWLGVYGDGTERVIVLERHGRLRALYPDAFETTLEAIDATCTVFVADGRADDGLRFENVAGIPRLVRFDVSNTARCGESMPRRWDRSTTFRIEPCHPRDELLRRSAAASPPPPPDHALVSDLVELSDLDASIRYDIRYATDENFLGYPVYDTAFARMQRPAANALVDAHRRLATRGLGIVVFDAWRPWRVTKMFWDATPASQHAFVADPVQGSRHNRGCAADISLFDRASGTILTMPSGYDEFTERAYPGWPGGTGRERALRELLRRTMEDVGFSVYEAEWWHFDYHDWRRYAVQ